MAEEPATKADVQEVRTELQEIRTELLESIKKVETTLLREFRKWAVSFESRFEPTKYW